MFSCTSSLYLCSVTDGRVWYLPSLKHARVLGDPRIKESALPFADELLTASATVSPSNSAEMPINAGKGDEAASFLLSVS